MEILITFLWGSVHELLINSEKASTTPGYKENTESSYAHGFQ